jgi:hypothetical protein
MHFIALLLKNSLNTFCVCVCVHIKRVCVCVRAYKCIYVYQVNKDTYCQQGASCLSLASTTGSLLSALLGMLSEWRGRVVVAPTTRKTAQCIGFFHASSNSSQCPSFALFHFFLFRSLSLTLYADVCIISRVLSLFLTFFLLSLFLNVLGNVCSLLSSLTRTPGPWRDVFVHPFKMPTSV